MMSLQDMKLNVRASPHLKSHRKTDWMMKQVIIALLLPLMAAIYFFGIKSLGLVLVGVASSVLFEYSFQKFRDQPVRINDYSAVITGMLIGLSVPVTAPYWTIIIGSFFAIVIIKQLPGGIGRNMFNPAVGARVMLKVFFSPWITNWVTPGTDAVSTATPLESIGHFSTTISKDVPGLFELFLGVNLGGNIGETSKLIIILAFIYLVVRGVINMKIPLLYVGTVAVISSIYGGFSFDYMMTHVLSGTLIFAAVFMATDYTSGALTPDGKTIFAICAGFLTIAIRLIFNFPGGVGFAILIMNALSPVIDKYLAPRIYGHKKRPKVALVK
ncbi:electron transport complex protein RnfD [Halolactibacillus halophilus]|uniref:Ion-translocating oxidoreductase complex subunit D n=1 Tax=Halolactibacillus halophilus TaxID=306540 RepID=A0A1I5MRQ5_9BACI|nr:RnfABCDGE type electron transport complex subunit D [Halolactibacillus halophilus]GEM01240.1 electron transport complex subunit D [Halolactibacillus halophilus]SFP12190.1 electron transport complex protein RnfD [Halolactibacillus halophilus]